MYPKSAFGQSSTYGQSPKSIFGASAMRQNFGQASTSQNQPIFGNTSTFFGTLSTQGAGNNAFNNVNKSIFGQPQNLTSDLNQMDTALSPNFGVFETNTGNDQSGTPIKFTPPTSQETTSKGGILNIRYQNIACMQEYESKSFEELRIEDYGVNRKGPQLSSFNTMKPSLGNSIFNNTNATISASSIFGQRDKPGFGQSTGAGYGQTSSGFGIFNTPGIGTNISTSTSPFSSAVQANNSIGSNNAFNNAFLNVTPVSTSFVQPSGFGTFPALGSTQTTSNPNTSFFNQNKPVSFNNQSTSSTNTLGIFGLPVSSNTNFQFSGPPTTSSNITMPNFSQSLYGPTNKGIIFNKPANKTTIPLFGQNKVNSLPGGGFPMGCGNSVFGSNTSTPNTMFSNTGQINNFGVTANTQGSLLQLSAPLHNNGPEQIILMASTPYGSTNLFNNISATSSDITEYFRPTSPIELNSILKGVNKEKTSTKTNFIRPSKVVGNKFLGLEYYDENLVLNTRINSNPKRLIIRHAPERIQISLDDIFIQSSASDTISNIHNDNASSGLQDLQENVENENNNSINYENTSTDYVNASENLSIHTNEKGNDGADEITVRESVDLRVDDYDNTSASSYETSSDVIEYCAGIILTRPEYYTVPSLDELVNYIDTDGCCIVKGFTIGRLGYGNVYFLDAFDVSNLNLDELVHFRHNEIIIYPDASKKPPLGQGLNRRAQVTLDKVWPRDKRTKVLITDVETLMEMDYAGKLRRSCERQETRFVDYRPDTGSWVFVVEHF